MKKVIFALAAVVALAACSKEQTLVTPQPDAIGFGTPFIENSTRVNGTEFTSVDKFNVWGQVTGNTNNSIFLYNGALVERNGAADGEAFKCSSQTEYWMPLASYDFLAISGATSVTPATGAFPTTIDYTADGNTDLLLSEYVTVETDNKAVPTTGVNANKCVPFTFKHLLSKVYFKFNNTSANDQCTYEISNITVSGAYGSGVYSIDNKKWTSVSGKAAALDFGTTGTIAQGKSATSDNAHVLLPGEQTITVSFKQKFYFNGTLMSETPDNAPITKELTTTFDPNGAYVINVNLQTGSAITFTLEKLTGWDDETTVTIP